MTEPKELTEQFEAMDVSGKLQTTPFFRNKISWDQ